MYFTCESHQDKLKTKSLLAEILDYSNFYTKKHKQRGRVNVNVKSKLIH